MNRWSEQGETGQKKLNSKRAPTAVLPKTKHVRVARMQPQLSQKFWPAPQGWSPTVNRGEPGFKGRIGCAGFVHPSHRAHRWAKVCF